MGEHTVRGMVGDKEVSLTTGKLARLADGAVTVRIGDTEVLTTATASRSMREGADFFPLTVDVEERMYAVGRIPGSFFRREGRATEKAILTCRLIDRPLRPNFPEGFRCETHVLSTILSADLINPYDIIALNGSSAALTVSPIPFDGPIGGVRLALIDGNWVAMPTYDELEEAVFDLIVVGKRNAEGGIDIVMVEAGSTEEGYRLVEAGAQPSDEATVTQGLEEAKAYIGGLIDLQLELKGLVGEIDPVEFPLAEDYSSELYEQIFNATRERAGEVLGVTEKKARYLAESAVRDHVFEVIGLDMEDAGAVKSAKNAFRSVMKNIIRKRVIDEGIRMDGRGATDIRDLAVEVGVVAEGHGSGLFQRGETQVLNVATLGM
ncbi:MAG: polyribonucleotide nucleotidyltransferase, partial [Acidimicrobiia bacterium]|nr:polyribonucleotide nucleotidyltransferase [Acidimicrobiia bacterium]